MTRLSFLRPWFALPIVLALAGVLLPAIAHAQLNINLAGSSWDDQNLKTATIKVTGATAGNTVRVIILRGTGPLSRSFMRSGVADNNGEVTVTLPTFFLVPGPGTDNYAVGDQICVSEVNPTLPLPARLIGRAKGQLAANGGIINQGPCPEPAFAAQDGPRLESCPECDAALTSAVPGFAPWPGLAAVALLGAVGLRRLARRRANA